MAEPISQTQIQPQQASAAAEPAPPPRSSTPETMGPGVLHRQQIAAAATPAAAPPPRMSMLRWATRVALSMGAALLLIYLMAAHVVIPLAWGRYLARHPAFGDPNMPRNTTTAKGIPGDPLNVGLIGTRDEIIAVMGKAKWVAADERTFNSCLKIAQATLFKKKYENAPVSDLFVYNRKQDLAFQYPLANPHQRHHVRFWESEGKDDEGRPLWVGAATFDDGVGIQYTTLQITHHIDPNVDEERDKLIKDLRDTGWLADVESLDDFHERLEGRNGGGHPYRTDGKLIVALVRVPEEVDSNE